ncbi:acetylglutamate kinase [Sinomicrobium weinanense]|uniref:Acetylglutamate kinase n=1 Tax=Sinomicrobium weinanense TaxID=2842200 RepID=A0A926JV45_9FLAO|nr:acetylglutamate kinase [Sinomicrobium weinanense]MBC9798122.1 acetylglutamate kinase [Sinomicrobium weinanense]MBU3122984.1 acetylglutamate kinase [Sinomicrobium weinanense]
MKPKLSIVKIGGNIIENESALSDFLRDFAVMEGQKILVHGGGRTATRIAEQLGVPAKMVGGRRITTRETLDVIVMVYGGLANKNIVSRLQSFDCNAIGLSGADGNIIISDKRPVKDIDYGFAGDIRQVNATTIKALLESGMTPVCCAITHNKKGQLLNTNADTITSEVAIAMSEHFETSLYYCFEKKGVLRSVEDDNSVIEHINTEKYEQLLQENVISDGMLPKMHNCFNALQRHVHRVYIGLPGMIAGKEKLFTTLTL